MGILEIVIVASKVSNAKSYTTRARLAGERDCVSTVLALVPAMDGIDHVVDHQGEAGYPHSDSWSAALSDDVRDDFHDIEIHALSQAAAVQVRDLVEVAVKDVVIVGFVERF